MLWCQLSDIEDGITHLLIDDLCLSCIWHRSIQHFDVLSKASVTFHIYHFTRKLGTAMEMPSEKAYISERSRLTCSAQVQLEWHRRAPAIYQFDAETDCRYRWIITVVSSICVTFQRSKYANAAVFRVHLNKWRTNTEIKVRRPWRLWRSYLMVRADSRSKAALAVRVALHISPASSRNTSFI